MRQEKILLTATGIMKKNNAFETKIKGLIAISSINQLDLLGDVKNDILKSIDFENYDVNNIDPKEVFEA